MSRESGWRGWRTSAFSIENGRSVLNDNATPLSVVNNIGQLTVTGGTLRPGSDVTDARWVLPSEVALLEVSDGLLEALRDFGLEL